MTTGKRPLGILYLLSFIGDMNLTVLNIATILMATRSGADTVAVGWLASGYGLSMIFLPLILGRLAEKYDRKRSISVATMGQVLVGLFFILFGREYIMLFAGMCLLGVTNSLFWPCVEASISEYSAHSAMTHKTSFFNYCVAWTFGSGIAPYIGGSLSDINVIYAFVFCTVVYLVGLISTLVFFPSGKIGQQTTGGAISSSNSTPNPPPDSASDPKSDLDSKGSESLDTTFETSQGHSTANSGDSVSDDTGLSGKSLLKVQIGLMLGVMVSTMGIKVIQSYFPNFAALHEGLGWTGTMIGIVSLGFGVGRVGFYIIGRLFDIKYRNMTLFLIVLGSSILLLSFVRDSIILTVIFFISGVSAAVIYITSLELLLKLQVEAKSTAAGVFDTFIGLGTALSPLMAGFIASFSLTLPFILYAVLAYTMSIIVLFLRNKNVP